MKKLIDKLEEILDLDMRKENKLFSDTELNNIKKKYNLSFSEGYEYYLKNYGNNYIKDGYYFIPSTSLEKETKQRDFSLNGIFGLYDNTNNLEKNILANIDNIKPNLFPIADRPGGNLVCMDKITGEIYFWFYDMSEDNDTFLVANSFDDFIDGFNFIKKEINTDGIKITVNSKFDAAMRKTAEKYKKK